MSDPAASIAARILRSGLRQADFPDGRRLTVLASDRELRSRELALAAGGLLAEGLAAPVRATLEALLGAQREDGLLPSRLDFETRAARFDAVDSNSLLCWTAARYCLAAPDRDWVTEVLPRLEKAMAYYDAREEDRLVPGAPFFTQLLRWRALGELSEMTRRLGALKACASWQGQARIVARQARKFFWDSASGSFREPRPLFCEGNLAAVAWGFADEGEGSLILRAIDRLGLNTPCGPASGRRWPWRRNPAAPTWTAALNLLALKRLGRKAFLAKQLAAIGECVAKAGFVPKDLPDGEASAWSAGTLLEALRLIGLDSPDDPDQERRQGHEAGDRAL